MAPLLAFLLLLAAPPVFAQSAAEERAYAEREYDRFAGPSPDKICLFTPEMIRRGSPIPRERAAAGEALLRSMFERLLKANGLPTLICQDGIVISGTGSGATVDKIGYAVIVAVGADFLSELENDGELAFVLAHELAHVELDHEARKYAFAAELARIPDNLGSRQAYGADLRGHKVREFMALRRRQELEADRRGLELAAAAGYDSPGAAAYFDRDAATYPPSKEPRWDSHPAPVERARALRAAPAPTRGAAAPGGELAAIRKAIRP